MELSSWPSWLEFQGEGAELLGNPQTLPSGASIPVNAILKSQGLDVGMSVSTVAFQVVEMAKAIAYMTEMYRLMLCSRLIH